MARNTKNITVSALDAVLIASLEPLVAALDHTTNQYGEKVDIGLDTGHELPSQRDMGIKIVLGQILQTLHNQCFGALNTRTGTKLPNAKEQLDASEQRLADLQNRLQDGTLTERDFQTLHWFHVNEARFNWLNEMITGYQTAYKQICGETWKPYERKDEKKIEVSEDEKKRLLALLSKASAKKVQPPVTPSEA